MKRHHCHCLTHLSSRVVIARNNNLIDNPPLHSNSTIWMNLAAGQIDDTLERLHDDNFKCVSPKQKKNNWFISFQVIEHHQYSIYKWFLFHSDYFNLYAINIYINYLLESSYESWLKSGWSFAWRKCVLLESHKISANWLASKMTAKWKKFRNKNIEMENSLNALNFHMRFYSQSSLFMCCLRLDIPLRS